MTLAGRVGAVNPRVFTTAKAREGVATSMVSQRAAVTPRVAMILVAKEAIRRGAIRIREAPRVATVTPREGIAIATAATSPKGAPKRGGGARWRVGAAAPRNNAGLFVAVSGLASLPTSASVSETLSGTGVPRSQGAAPPQPPEDTVGLGRPTVGP
jgi:hypothetical protein